MISKVRIKFDKLYGESSKAYLLLINNKEIWFPKRFCWEFTLNKKLGGHTIIPTWIYREKFGCEHEECDAATIVYHHIPEKIQKVMSNEINELKK